MEKSFKIVLINHSFQINYYSRRWALFAEKHPNVDVTLLAPKEYEWYAGAYTFSGGEKKTSYEISQGNFHRRLIEMDSKKGWKSKDYKTIFKEIEPDVVYLIGSVSPALYQILKLRKKYFPKMKVLNFSMRGPVHNLTLDIKGCSPLQIVWRLYKYVRSKYWLNYFNKELDAVFCHYPDAVLCFREEGYSGPIYMQTQVGVNTEWFHPDKQARIEIRTKYGIDDDTFLFGSATRFSPDKGLSDIIKALPRSGNWKYIMMGTGTEEQIQSISSLIRDHHLEDRIIMPGMIDWYEIAKYWNAIDCAIHVPRTTAHWVETFSLSAVQPQATMKPVVGNSSGSVPYQLGFDGMIVPEGDIPALREKLSWVLNHQEEASIIGQRMYNRTISSFTVQHLNDMFYDTIIEDILPGKYDINKVDMTKYSPKSHEV